MSYPWHLGVWVVWGWSSWHSRNHECSWRNPKALKIWAMAWEVAGNVRKNCIIIPLKWCSSDWWNQWGLLFRIFPLLEFVQGGTVFLYHSCKQKNTRLRTGIGLRCVLPGDLKIKVASAQHIFTKGDCAGIPWGGNWSQNFVVVITIFCLLRINSSYFTMASECDVFTCSWNLQQKETMLVMVQEAARELISNVYLPHPRVFKRGSWSILR